MKRVGELYYFTAVFDDDGPITSTGRTDTSSTKVCKKCKESTSVLHHDPDRPGDCFRVICGKCQGDANRLILGGSKGHRDDR